MDDSRLDRIESKVDKILEHVGNLDVVAAKQEVSLAEHIRRTLLLEKAIEPIKKHVSMVSGAVKLLGMIAVGIGVAEGVVKILEFFK